MMRVPFIATMFRAMAFISSRGATSSASSACRAGMLKANSVPWNSPTANRIGMLIRSTVISTAVIPASTPVPSCEISTRLRLFIRSATAPPCSENSSIGMPHDIITTPTEAKLPVISKASQPRATICICMPVNDATCDIQSAR